MRFEDLPDDIKRAAAQTVQEQVGGGYTPDHYESIIADWLWLYSAGIEEGKRRKKKK